MKGQFIIQPDDEHAMRRLGAYIRERLKAGAARISVAKAESERTLEQNDKMWAMLGDVSKQVQWPVDGRLVHMDSEDWKNVFTAALKHEQRVAQGINGGFVMLGQRTSKLGVRAMTDLIEVMYAFGAERRVIWSDPKQPRPEDYADWRQAA